MKILNKCILITTQGQGTKFYCGNYPEDKKRCPHFVFNEERGRCKSCGGRKSVDGFWPCMNTTARKDVIKVVRNWTNARRKNKREVLSRVALSRMGMGV